MKRFYLLCAASLSIITLLSAACMAEDGKETKPSTIGDVYPALTTGMLANAKMAALPNGVLLQSGSTKILQKDLDTEIGRAPEAVRPQLRKNAFFLLEQKATRDLIAIGAKAWALKSNGRIDDKSPTLLSSYFGSLTSQITITDAEVQEFYDKNKDMVGDATFDQVKDQLKDYVLNEKRQGLIDGHISSMGTRTAINVNESWVSKQYPLSMDNSVDKARTSGKPSLVDFGADGCRPCDMMVPVLASLTKEYEGKLNVLFVHVRNEQILAARFGIQSIPVQVFFDKDGKEVFRHVGFFAKEQIAAKLTGLGVK